MSCIGSAQSNEIQEVGHLLLSHCSDDGVLGDFPVTMASLGRSTQIGFVVSVEESQVEVSIWPEMT